MEGLPRELLIIQEETASGNDAALAALADFLGLDARPRDFTRLLSAPCGCRGRVPAAVSGKTLARVLARDLMERLRAFLREHVSSLLVYAVEPAPAVATSLSALTGDIVKGIGPALAGRAYEVRKDAGDICGELAGLALGPVESVDHVFDTDGDTDAARTLVEIGGRPIFLSVGAGGCPVFLSGAARVADVSAPVADRPAAGALFSRLAPAAMYLKAVFGPAVWHKERSRACLVVDDPLLREEYGFLSFPRLAELMDSVGFATSVGFIPWNFKRTSPGIARLFKARPDRFSLCVHGCDHTQAEFGLIERRALDAMIGTATERMNRHSLMTGVAFDNVMVFPQGVFSIPAMEALRAGNYLAAVNLDPFPLGFRGSLELKAFLEPAVTTFGAFPLFLRRLPEEVAEIAMDLFWGRPALILAHHTFFKGDYRPAMEAIGRINAIDGGVEWRGLGEILRRSYLSKEQPDSTIRVKAYVSDVLLENRSPIEKRFVVTKKEAASTQVSVSLASGRKVEYELSGGELRLELTVGARSRESVVITYPDCPACQPAPRGLGQALRVRARRHLSEMRDNYISKNEFLLSLAIKLKERLLA